MIKLLVCDFDGVFTNDLVTFDANGKIVKSYNIKDGMGIKLLKDNNLKIGVISGYIENESQKKLLEHLNIDYISFGSNDIENVINKNIMNKEVFDCVYISDSFGNMVPAKSREVLLAIMSGLSCLNIPIGYHIHENIGNGFSNSIESIDLQIDYLDTSLFGIGKGNGNLSMNHILLYLHSIQKQSVDDTKILLLLQFCDKHFPDKTIENVNILQGVYNIHPTSFKMCMDTSSAYNTFNNLKLLTNLEKYHYTHLK